MIPPIIRYCPACGHVGLSRRFVYVDEDATVVECPSCGHRFEPIDTPLLK